MKFSTADLPSDTDALTQLRSACHGIVPLEATIEPWMTELLSNQQDLISDAVTVHGSPLNIVSTGPFQQNIAALNRAAEHAEIAFRVFFARKANKCLAFVEAAIRSGAGVDVASEQECRQAIAAGANGADVICTAAIKTRELIEFCIAQGVTIAVDNISELDQIVALAQRADRTASCAIRFSGFEHDGVPLHSRFGFNVSEASTLIARLAREHYASIKVDGLHFHLDGYSASQRISAIEQSLVIVDAFRASGQPVTFLDIGGGFPVSYLEQKSQWDEFWKQHRAALRGEAEPLTYRNHGLGLTVVGDEIIGRPQLYPYWQAPVGADWFSTILNASPSENGTIADAIRKRSLQLRCEPGRNLLYGCGSTIARVEYVKQHISGVSFVGLAMNRTQCRTSSDDFLVDPLLLRQQSASGVGSSDKLPAREGFLTGAYCTESEFLMLRKLRFPHGVAVGDLVIFPNTAGYLMHFLESRSHQFPLAKNLIYDPQKPAEFKLDGIDVL